MENRSRVERYKDLRKKIENMDVYSFAETSTQKRNLPQHASHEDGQEMAEKTPKGITKNTLNMSIEQLIKEHDSYTQEQQKKAIKDKYREKRKPFHLAKSDLWRILLFVAIAIIVLVVVALIVLFAMEVI